MEVRLVKDSDLSEVLDIYQYYIKHTDVTFEYDVPQLATFKDQIQDIIREMPFLVAIENNQVVGYVYASKFAKKKAYSWSVETTIYLDKDYLHKGIGKVLYQTLFKILKKMGYCRCYACITYSNPDSTRFHKKFGFKDVGIFHQAGYKFNRWLDVIYMEKDIQKLKHPDFPRSIHEIDMDSLL